MASLPLLMTLTVRVGKDQAIDVGAIPAGRRSIVPILGGSADGDRLRGTVRASGFDWTLDLPDGSQQIDVRTVLDTHDGAVVYLAYQGRFAADDEAMQRLVDGEPVEPDNYSLAATFAFECGDDRYGWLNGLQAVGHATFTPDGLVYSVYATPPAHDTP